MLENIIGFVDRLGYLVCHACSAHRLIGGNPLSVSSAGKDDKVCDRCDASLPNTKLPSGIEVKTPTGMELVDPAWLEEPTRIVECWWK